MSGSDAEVQAQIEQAGFYWFIALGKPDDDPVAVEIYKHAKLESFWALVTVGSDIFDVMFEGFPCMWLFIHQAANIVQTARTLENN